MSQEIYLNHPTFGLLYKLCNIENNQELFTTLYAQRLFFKVTINKQNTSFESLTRSDARLLLERQLRQIRQNGDWEAHKVLNEIYKRTFP